MAFFANSKGARTEYTLTPDDMLRATNSGMSLPQYINRQFSSEVDLKQGTPWNQIKASVGFMEPGAKNPFGLRSPTLHELMFSNEGGSMQMASGQAGGTAPASTIYGGTETRLLFPTVVIEMAEARLLKDLAEDPAIFDSMVALDMPINGANFEQPIINYETPGGPQGANRMRPQRISEFAEPAAMIRFGTSDKIRKIPAHSIGMEFSHQALKNTSLDLVGLTLARHLLVERQARVDEQLSDLFTGDADINVGAITAVTSTSLDSTASGGTLTWAAWIKWLRRSKVRKITHVVCDIDSWIKVVKATGRPGAGAAQDTRVSVPDPAPVIRNPYFGENVTFYIVDSAADGGPVPANTLWGLDARTGIVRVSNTEAQYEATQDFAMRRSTAMRWDTSLLAYRQFDESFDVLTIA